MPRVRLVGLFLFITAIFIALAAAATRTSSIRFQRPGVASDTEAEGADRNGTSHTAESHAELHFVSVPIVFPLVGVGFVGLLLWFLPAASFTSSRKKPRRKRRRRRK